MKIDSKLTEISKKYFNKCQAGAKLTADHFMEAIIEAINYSNSIQLNQSITTINNTVIIGDYLRIEENRIIVNDVDVTPDTKVINIEITGNVGDIKLASINSLVVNGNADTVNCVSGEVVCGDVYGSVINTSGNITCKKVGGNVNNTTGKISCDQVFGSVQTKTGNIKYVKV